MTTVYRVMFVCSEQALLAIEAAMPGVMAAIRREAGPRPAT
jgi:hypothetical protein